MQHTRPDRIDAPVIRAGASRRRAIGATAETLPDAAALARPLPLTIDVTRATD